MRKKDDNSTVLALSGCVVALIALIGVLGGIWLTYGQRAHETDACWRMCGKGGVEQVSIEDRRVSCRCASPIVRGLYDRAVLAKMCKLNK